MLANDASKILSGLGFGWLLKPDQKIEKLPLSSLNVIPLLGSLDFGFALGQYSEPKGSQTEKTQVGRLLYGFKYQFDQSAGVILADLAAELINSQNLLKSSDFIVTVPPSFTSRPFDPVSFLAERISQGTGIYWEKDVIKRTRITAQQKRFFRKELKEENVELAFSLNDPQLVNDKKILLFDDLYASGSTINQISQILRQAKADKIFVLVLAKTRYV
ncbi:MAG: ComF family protein [candidate division Zixibacteria bacterium]|nr:ComF family protein [candidate division Zixibacteria bacterium]MCK4428476.1 ComF family protein [candidate division Zixibacteria bacterium]